MKKVVLDAGDMGEPEKAHQYLKERLELDEYYGGNLDALYDCLTEMEETVISISGCSNPGSYLQRIIRVMLDAEEENGGLTIRILQD